MRNPFRKIQERDERRWLTRGVKAWERRRAKGARRFVSLYGFLWCAVMSLIMVLPDYFRHRPLPIDLLYGTVAVNLTLGLIAGFVTWNLTEDKYRQTIKRKP
jgi:hypothetical protein